MRPLLASIHRWVGLALSLVLLVVSLSGVLLLARGPYYRWQYPSFAHPVTQSDEAGFARVLERIDERFGAQVRTVKVPQPGMRVFQVWLEDGTEAFVDAGSGQVIDRWRPAERLPALIFDMHAHLMGGHRGETINGVIAVLALLFLVLGGVLVWWPRRGAMRLRAVWPSTWTPGSLLRSHAALGVITAVPLTLFLITGAGLALAPFVLPAMSRALDARPAPPVITRVGPPSGPRASWSSMLASIEQAFPPDDASTGNDRAHLVFLAPGREPSVPIVARVRLPGEWHPNGRSVVVVNPYTGRVVQTVDARQQGAGTRLGHLLYPLHAARVGANTSWLLVALAIVAGVGLAALCGTGVTTWLQRRVPRRATRDGRGRVPRRARRDRATGERALPS